MVTLPYMPSTTSVPSGAEARASLSPATGRWRTIVDWFDRRKPSEDAVLLAFAVAIGVLSAAGVVAFYRSIDLAYAVFFSWPERLVPRLGLLAYRPLITGAGVAVAWAVMRRIGHGHDGMNIPDVQLAVVRRGGDIPSRPAFARTLASAITIGAGGSAGSEGPVVVLGAAIASWLGRNFRFTARRVTVLVGCASGAAISAAFNAPLAGAFFALEEILGSFGGSSFAPVVVSSVVAAVVSRSVFGNHPAFPIPTQYGYGGFSDIVIGFPLLGVVCGLIAALYVRTYFSIAAAASTLRIRGAMLPWIGGALVGLMVFLSNGALVGDGHVAIALSMFGRSTLWTLALLTAGKILATSITLNSGGSGGVFTPSLYIGATTGGAVGLALSHFVQGRPEAYALVGMGAMIAGATDAPITGVLLVFEMTNDYGLVLPLMLTVVIARLVARRTEADSLYSGWLRRRGESIEHGEDRTLLEIMRVSDAYDPSPRVIHEAAPARQFLAHLGHSSQTIFPVVDDAHRVIGVISVAELGELARSPREADAILLAADLAQPSESVTLADTLLESVRRMGVRGLSALPVIDPETERLVGLVSRGDILSAYERRVGGERS
jgi:chloride channel protein, CIC family